MGSRSALRLVAALACAFTISTGTRVSANQGTIVEWGFCASSCDAVPVGSTFTALAVGMDHNLALRANGTIAAWGFGGVDDDDDVIYGAGRNLLDVPTGNGFTGIAAGRYHSLALKSDGSLVSWGLEGPLAVPAGNDFSLITAAGDFNFARKTDGSLVGWHHQNGAAPPAIIPPNNLPSTAFWGFDAGEISIDGGAQLLSVYSNGIFRFSPSNPSLTGLLTQFSGLSAIGTDQGNVVAIRTDATLRALSSTAGTPPPGFFSKIAAGSAHGLAISTSGALAAWGANNRGQTVVPEGSDYIAVAAAGERSLAIKFHFYFAGDFNQDSFVDAEDYTVWRDNLGTDFDLGGNGDDEGDSTGIVDLADYALWKANFGAYFDPCGGGGGTSCVGSGAANVSHTSTAVPEPGCGGLVAIAALLALSLPARARGVR